MRFPIAAAPLAIFSSVAEAVHTITLVFAAANCLSRAGGDCGAHRDDVVALMFPMFEKFDLTETLFCLSSRFIRSAEIFPLLRQDFVPFFNFLDHGRFLSCFLRIYVLNYSLLIGLLCRSIDTLELVFLHRELRTVQFSSRLIICDRTPYKISHTVIIVCGPFFL